MPLASDGACGSVTDLFWLLHSRAGPGHAVSPTSGPHPATPQCESQAAWRGVGVTAINYKTCH